MADVSLRAVHERDRGFLERLDTDATAVGEFEWQGFSPAQRLVKQWEENGLIGPMSSQLAIDVGADTAAGIATWRTASRGGPVGVCYEIGVALLPEFRGQGFGREAHRLLVEYLFGYTTVERLEALTDNENLVERHVLEVTGFQKEGVLRHAVWQRGGWRDLVLYARLRDE